MIIEPTAEYKALITSCVANPIIGVDESSVQGSHVDYPLAARARIRFSIPKCTTGATGQDPDFARNVDAADEAGVDVPAAYHWLSSQTASVAQVANYLAHGGARVKSCRCMIDFEDQGSDGKGAFAAMDPRAAVAMCEEFAKRIADVTGLAPIVYTGRWFAPWAKGADSEFLATLMLLHAAYPLFGKSQWSGKDRTHYEAFVRALPHEDRLDIAGPWAKRGHHPIIHQIDGNDGLLLPQGIDCDFDLFLGDERAYQAFILESTGKPAATLLPPAPPGSNPPNTDPQTPTSKSSQRLPAVDAPIIDLNDKE